MTIVKSAWISTCGRYRYRLGRFWGPGATLPFVMLNPSTADADVDDPTIRRCIGFARREGACGIVVVNLFAFRATSPKVMKAAADPYGPDNEAALRMAAKEAAITKTPIVCAWGSHAPATMARSVVRMLSDEGVRLVCLGRTAGKGAPPRHPLYVPGAQQFEDYAP